MSTAKVLLLNQSLSEVAAFDAEGIPYLAVYVEDCPVSARVEYFNGPHSYSVKCIEDLRKLAAIQQCTYLASYRDGSARLCNEAQLLLGLESNCDSSYFEFFHDKLHMNRELVKLGEKRKFGELYANDHCAFPGAGNYIFKPKSLQGSAGVRCYRISNADDWQEQLRSYFGEIEVGEYSEGYLWEEFVEGQEYSVDVYVHDQKVHLLGFARKATCFIGNFIESSHVVGDVIENEQAGKILDKIQVLFSRIGYGAGPAHIEFKLNKANELHFIEFHPRPGGDHLIELIWLATGASLVDHLFAHINKTPVALAARRGLFSVIQYLSANPTSRCVRLLEQFAEIRVRSGLSESAVLQSSRDRPAFIKTKGLTLDKLAELMDATSCEVDWDQRSFIVEKAGVSK